MTDKVPPKPHPEMPPTAREAAVLNDVIAGANSLRDAHFALRTRYQPFLGVHLGFEHVIGGNRHVRGDLINPTTLPASLGALYAQGGGAAFDPVVQSRLRARTTRSLI